MRRVEAAIGLRSSTESPERSSSPESDSIMMADRNVMTLPLRKRKHYMNEGDSSNGNGNGNGNVATAAATNGGNEAANAGSASNNSNNNNGSKVMRMSSVIQFAKAS